MKNAWGDEIEEGPAAAVNEWGDPIESAAPAKSGLTLAQAAFPGAHADYQPQEVLQPWGNIPGQKPLTRTMGPREQAVGPAIMDALSLPSRLAGTAGAAMGYEGATGGKQGLEALADSETGLMRPARQAMGQSMAQSVAGMKDPKKDWAERAGHAVGAGIAGIGYGVASGIEDPTTWIPGVGMAAKTKTAGKVFAAGEKIANLPNRAAGKLAQELSSVSEEALRMATTKEGRAALKANAGKEYEIGQKIVDMLDNPKEYAPNKALIDNAVNGMGEVDIMPAVKALQKAKIQRPSGKLLDYEKAANAEIQKDINALLGTTMRTKIPAGEALDLQRSLSAITDFNTSQNAANIANRARLSGRKAMKDLLEARAIETKNPGYIEGMRSAHKQLDARDRIEAFLGKNKEAQEDRAQSFISNMWGKNRRNREKVLSDLGDAFGKDFIEESKLANLASQLGPEGEATWFSRASTGRSKLGGALGFFAGGSPKIATRVILPLAEQPPKVFKWLKGLSEAKNPQQVAFYTANLEKTGIPPEEIKAAVDLAVPPPGPIGPAKAAAEPQTILGAERAFRRRVKAMEYLKARDGKEPPIADVYRFMDELGDQPIPVIPKKPKVEREFDGRREGRHLEFLKQALKEGVPGFPTKDMKAADLPKTFSLQGTKFRRGAPSKNPNIIVVVDDKGQKHLFNADEKVHMDYEKDEVPF